MNTPSLIRKISARLKYSESNGGEYNAVNDTTNALGKYQFVPSHHWNKIKSFAKENGYLSLAAQEGKAFDYDYFLENPSLQEEYFGKYVESELTPWVKNSLKDNKRNLDPDEIAQLYHMYPEGVKKYIQGGEWAPPGKQTPILEYLAKGKKGLVEAGLGPATKADFMSKDEIDQNVLSYFAERNKLKEDISAGKYSEGAGKSLMKNLNQKYHDIGIANQINIEVSKRRYQKGQDFESEKKVFSDFYDALSNADNENFHRIYNKDTKSFTLEAANGVGKVLLERFNRESNGQLKYAKNKYAKSTSSRVNKEAITFKLDPSDSGAKYIVDNINKYSDRKENFSVADLTKNEKFQNPDTDFSWKHFFMDNPVMQAVNFNKKLDMDELEPTINISELKSEPEKNYEVKKKDEQLSKDLAKKEENKTEAEKQAEKQEAAATGSDSFANMLSLYDVDEPYALDYEKESFKKEIPFEAAAQGIIGMMGMNAADNEIPMRTEEISAGLEQYIEDIRKISKIGLPPELEAKAKADISESAYLAQQNIVAASGGNRNLVLGNQGQIEVAKMKAMNELAIKDFQVKVQAGNKYGEAMKYVNEFEANKNIANTITEQGMAFQDRAAAGELSGTAFNSMIESIRAQKERAPGTAYHALLSKYQMDALGYVPSMEDDGTGKPGTRSAFLKQADEINLRKDNIENIQTKYAGFSPEKQKLYSEAAAKTGMDFGKMSKMADFFGNNNEADMNMNRLDQAISNDDYSYLIEQQKAEAQTAPGFKALPEADIYDQYVKSY